MLQNCGDMRHHNDSEVLWSGVWRFPSYLVEVKCLKGFHFLTLLPKVKATSGKMHLKTIHILPLDIVTGLVSPFFSGWWAQLFLWLAGSSGEITVLVLHRYYDFHTSKH